MCLRLAVVSVHIQHFCQIVGLRLLRCAHIPLIWGHFYHNKQKVVKSLTNARGVIIHCT